MAITVLLVDDHAVVREGLQALLGAQPDIQVVGSFGATREAVAFASSSAPEVAVLDIAMPDMDGIEGARMLRSACPETQILMLSMHNSSEHVYQALRAGASGYVLKESAGREVAEAIRTVHAGRRYLSQKISPAELEHYIAERGGSDPLERLSPRETQVLKLVVEGHTSSEVAALIGVSPKSVDTYRSRIMAKLDIDDLPGLVKFAIRKGLTSL